jgi:tight adherence protein B
MNAPLSLPSGGALVAMIFVAAFAVMLLLGAAIAPGNETSRRLRRRIEQARRTGRADAAQARSDLPMSVRRDLRQGLLAPLNRRILALLPRAETVGERLTRAGLTIGAGDFLLLCALAGVGTAVAIQLYWHPPLYLSACASLIAGTGVPHMLIGSRIASRSRKFVALLSDAIDLIVRGIRSGLPVAEAINAIGHEIAEPVGSTFREVTGNLRLGMTMDEALWAAARRLQVQEFKFFVISLSIQQETGGNLAEILQNLSQMIRRREQVKLKIKAMSSEARASAMIIGSLPFIMCGVIYVINPTYIMQLFTDPRGWLLVGAGLTSMALGLGVIAKMVRFEV